LFRRRNTLGFSFHAEVAALDDGEQDRLLDRAIAEGWTRQTLRLAVRQERDPYAQPLENHQLINQSDNDRWFTPAPFLDAAHELMGGIDLDPASEEFANRIVRAARFFTEDDDGLARPWAGRVWLNPPYGLRDGESNQARWSRALIERHAAGDVTEALLLVNAVTGNQWFAPLKRYPICFPDNRIRFYNEETEAGQPTHSNAIVYFGPAIDRFAAIFGRFGAVLATREVWDGAR
jgi:ParB family chromosome partitioning protein